VKHKRVKILQKGYKKTTITVVTVVFVTPSDLDYFHFVANYFALKQDNQRIIN
jgi:hypothetical protein